jgi:hypothetical protein
MNAEGQSRVYPSAKHFLIVGVVFAILLGWVGTMIINPLIGAVAENFGGVAMTKSYFFASLLMGTSISIIGACIWLGNKTYARRWREGFERKHLIRSTMLFLIFVLFVVIPQITEVLSGVMSNLSSTHRNPGNIGLRLSLPLFRLIVLPTLYYFIAVRTLTSRKREGLVGQEGGSGVVDTDVALSLSYSGKVLPGIILAGLVTMMLYTCFGDNPNPHQNSLQKMSRLHERAYPKISHDGNFLIVFEDGKVRKIDLVEKRWSPVEAANVGWNYSISLDSQWLLTTDRQNDNAGFALKRIRIAPPYDVEIVHAWPHPIYSPSEIEPGKYLMILSMEPHRGRASQLQLWHVLEPGGKLSTVGTENETNTPWDQNIAITAQGIIRTKGDYKNGKTPAEKEMNPYGIPFNAKPVSSIDAMITPDTRQMRCSRDLSVCLRLRQDNSKGVGSRTWLDAVVNNADCDISGMDEIGFAHGVYITQNGKFGSAIVTKKHNQSRSAAGPYVLEYFGVVFRFPEKGCPIMEIISLDDTQK